MPLRSDWSQDNCPIARSLDVLGDPWVLLIMRNVLEGFGTFDALRNGLGIADAVLSRRLAGMVDAGLLMRVDYRTTGRLRQGYAATPAGAELLPVLQQLALWGDRHTAIPEGGGRMRLMHDACGAETTQGETCSACGAVLVPQEMSWAKEWSGARDRLMPPGVLAAATG